MEFNKTKWEDGCCPYCSRRDGWRKKQNIDDIGQCVTQFKCGICDNRWHSVYKYIDTKGGRY